MAGINIKNKDIYKDIKILNSYEEYIRDNPDERLKRSDIYKNENEIKQREIKINDKAIPFNYYLKFISKGKCIIKYSFKKNLKSTFFLFGEIKSLTKINLSNFNTNETIIMAKMFYDCSSLKEINLSNFNTNNVINMWSMFSNYSSLKDINLSSFNTKNVTSMTCMFYKCSSLTNINLSNFNTNNVTNMSGMFCECSSLKILNLSNFNTNNVDNMDYIFSKCPSLNKTNIITKDEKILNSIA